MPPSQQNTDQVWHLLWSNAYISFSDFLWAVIARLPVTVRWHHEKASPTDPLSPLSSFINYSAVRLSFILIHMGGGIWETPTGVFGESPSWHMCAQKTSALFLLFYFKQFAPVVPRKNMCCRCFSVRCNPCLQFVCTDYSQFKQILPFCLFSSSLVSFRLLPKCLCPCLVHLWSVGLNH